MAIANCKRCGRIFNRTRRDICPFCVVEEDKAFQVVRTYLREYREATMAQVVKATGFEAKLITDLIRDGRLILRDNPNLTYACDRCGKPTQSGRYCPQCTRELAASLGNGVSKSRKPEDNRGES